MIEHFDHTVGYAVGNSWQLNSLSDEERELLDSEYFVVCCNKFLSHWRIAGFRPTFWVYGDTRVTKHVTREIIEPILTRELEALQNDEELHERLKGVFICIESDWALDLVRKHDIPVPVTIYERYSWVDKKQVMARTLDETIFHYGSTLTDAINILHIIMGGTIKITGCQYMTKFGHFYDEPEEIEDLLPFPQPDMCDMYWEGLSMLKNNGVNIIDCNVEHGAELKWDFERSSLL